MLVKGLFTQMSGSVGGVTGSHNRGGLYVRARAIPVNPSTAEQQVVRNAMGINSTAWTETLTEVQREGWRTYATNTPIVGPLGDPRNIGGIAMFNRANVARAQAELEPVLNAPQIFDLGTFTAPQLVAVDSATDTADFNVTDTDEWANENGSAMLVFASRPQNQSIASFKGPYRFAGAIMGSAMTPPTNPQTINLPFPVTADQKVFFKINVTRADGRYSTAFRTVGIAADV